MSTASGPIGRVRRQLLRRCTTATLGSLVMTVVVAVAAPGIGRAAGETGLDHSEQERRRQREHQAELATQLDPTSATSEQLIAALTTLDLHLQSQIALANEAERAQRDADRRLAEYRTELGGLQTELAGVTNALRTQAVRLYLEPERADSSIRLLKADTFDDAEQRRVLGDAVSGNSRELSDRMRVAKARRDSLNAQATAARDETQARQRERQDLLGRVLAGQDAQRRLQGEWDKRMVTLARGGDNIGETSDLDRAIAEQRARLGTSAPAPSASGGFMWPANGPITDTYGYLASRKRNHWGLDIGAPTGANVVAAQSGKVVAAGWSGDYGNLIAIDHEGGLETRYAHLSRMRVSVGATVAKGQLIGAVGSTGNSTGPHLHFEVYLNGAHVNPRNYLP